MLNPLEKLKAFIEKGARNSASDAKSIQAAHDAIVAAGAECTMSEAADFSQHDVMTLLNSAVKKQFKDNYSYPYIYDVFDTNLVFGTDYSASACYRCDYSVSENGVVTLGQPVAVVRKVTYIEPNTVTSESINNVSPIVDNENTLLLEAGEVELFECMQLYDAVT